MRRAGAVLQNSCGPPPTERRTRWCAQPACPSCAAVARPPAFPRAAPRLPPNAAGASLYRPVPQMSELRPYRQGLLDAAQIAARLLTISVFLAIGISNYLAFGSQLQVVSP